VADLAKMATTEVRPRQNAQHGFVGGQWCCASRFCAASFAIAAARSAL